MLPLFSGAPRAPSFRISSTKWNTVGYLAVCPAGAEKRATSSSISFYLIPTHDLLCVSYCLPSALPQQACPANALLGGKRSLGNAIHSHPRKFLKLGGVSDDVVGDVPVLRVPSAIGTPLPVSKVAESSSQARRVLALRRSGQGSKRVGERPPFVGPLTWPPSNQRAAAILGDSSRRRGLEFPVLARALAPSLKSKSCGALAPVPSVVLLDETTGTDKNLPPKIAARLFLAPHFCEPILLPRPDFRSRRHRCTLCLF
jgi:hypothetical protein